MLGGGSEMRNKKNTGWIFFLELEKEEEEKRHKQKEIREREKVGLWKWKWGKSYSSKIFRMWDERKSSNRQQYISYVISQLIQISYYDIPE